VLVDTTPAEAEAVGVIGADDALADTVAVDGEEDCEGVTKGVKLDDRLGVAEGGIDHDGLADTAVPEGEASTLVESVPDALGDALPVAEGTLTDVVVVDADELGDKEGVTDADELVLTVVPDGAALTDNEGVTIGPEADTLGDTEGVPNVDGPAVPMVADGEPVDNAAFEIVGLADSDGVTYAVALVDGEPDNEGVGVMVPALANGEAVGDADELCDGVALIDARLADTEGETDTEGVLEGVGEGDV
jgi:hypothetical protein